MLLLENPVVGWEWSKVLYPVLATLTAGIIMLVINHWREGSKQYSNRIKVLEVTSTTHENRFTMFHVEREALVEKINTRFTAIENKLNTVDLLSVEVARLTNEMAHQSKSLDKIEKKFDDILLELRKKP